jgi:hypothetical protein
MLKLFAQLFHSEAPPSGRFPEDLVLRAIERVLDATDPRIRVLSGYAKQMRDAVQHAMEHVAEIDQALLPPIPMSHDDWSQQAVLGAMFASSERLTDTLERDKRCRNFRTEHPLIDAPVTALLVAKNSEKHILGIDLINDNVVNDVPLTIANFDDHHLLGLAIGEHETRRRLQLRTFDYLQVLVLAKISAVKQRRKDLMTQRKALNARLSMYARSASGPSADPHMADIRTVKNKLQDIEAELAAMGPEDQVLQKHLQIIIDTLGAAEKQVWLESHTLYMDSMNTLRPAGHAKARAVPVQLLRDNGGRRFAVQLVSLPPEAFL